ncbi:carboxypeptidase regulatory-like domain-containing protein [bacterium]|nr:carboxypeptidase regulatory-like domain-containing protein [bacterium]
MRYFCYLGLLMLLLYLSGCGGGGGGLTPPTDNNPPPPPYNIYGTVTDTRGIAIVGATVSASYKDNPNDILDTKTTDKNGKYYLWVPVAQKTYVVKASSKGYQEQTKEITLSPPDYQKEVNFQLQPVDKR